MDDETGAILFHDDLTGVRQSIEMPANYYQSRMSYDIANMGGIQVGVVVPRNVVPNEPRVEGTQHDLIGVNSPSSMFYMFGY